MRRVNSFSVTLAGLVVLLLGSCMETEESGPPMFQHEIGDPCGSATESCIDEHTVQRCVDNIWAALDCDDVCVNLGPAYVSGACVDEVCECVLADPNACTPGDTVCMDPAAVSLCSESQTWEVSDCQAKCQESGLTSVGCVEGEETAACWCSAEGTPCDPNTPAVCADSVTLAVCIDDEWVFEDCALGCPAGTCVGWKTPSFCNCL